MWCALTGNLNSVFSRWECGLELHVFLHWFYLLYLYFPPLLEKGIEQLLHQSLEPTLSVWSRRRRSGNLREQVVSTLLLTTSFFLRPINFRRVNRCPFRIDRWPYLFPTWRPPFFSDQFSGGLTDVPWLLTLYFFPTRRPHPSFSDISIVTSWPTTPSFIRRSHSFSRLDDPLPPFPGCSTRLSN